ncbi:phage major capsid protein [Pseudonocardia halophobica]|uniref:phage major capsid protein n=1 Tax=Pseudonocardia halophobica TaxID=29401 RepID=UPI003D8B37DF
MPSYNDVIDRVGAASEVPAEIAEAIVGEVETQSTALTLGRRVPTTTRDSRIPVLSSTPDAYWVTGDRGLKQTSAATFDSTPLIAEELAVIIAVPDSVIADSEFGIWEAIRPLVARAFARRLDRAVIFGEEAPPSWPAGMVTAALAAGHTVNASGDPVVDLLGAAQKVAEAEYNPSAAAVATGWQYRAAATRTDAFTASPVGANAPFPLSVAGLGVRTDPVYWDADAADVVVADWSNVLIGIRQDLTIDFSNSAVITDEDGNITNNMFQRDSTAMRAVMRVGYHLAQPVTQSGTASVPVAIVNPASPQS